MDANRLISEVTIRDQASASANRIASALEKLALAEEGVADGAARSTRSIENSARTFDRLKAAADPVFASQQRLARAQIDLNRVVELGVASQAEADAVMAQHITLANQQIAAQSKVAAAFGLSSGAMASLRAAGINSFQALAAGISPFTVATTEAAQVLGAFLQDGKIGLATLAGIGGTVAAVAAVVGTFAIAAHKGAAESAAFNRALELSANAAGVTADSYNALLDRVRDVSSIGPAAARAIGTEMIATGKFSAAAIQQILSITQKYGEATGATAEVAGKSLTKMFSDPQQALKQLDDQYNLLSDRERQHIRDLIEQGNRTQAQIDLSRALGERIDGLSQHLGLLERAWQGISGAASSAWDAMKGIGRDQTLEQRIQGLRAAIELSKQGNLAALGGAVTGSTADLQRQLDILLAAQQASTQVAENDSRTAKLREEDKALGDLARGYGTFSSRQEELANEYVRVTAAIALANEALDSTSGRGGGAGQRQRLMALIDTWGKLIDTIKVAQQANRLPSAESQRQIDIQSQVTGLLPYQRGPQSAYLSAVNAGLDSTDEAVRNDAFKNAANVRRLALLQITQGVIDQNRQLDVNAALTLKTAQAYQESNAAGAAAAADQKAALEALQAPIDTVARAQQYLAQQTADAILAGAQQVRQMTEQAQAAERLAQAAGQGPLAFRQAQIDEQVRQATQSSYDRLANTDDPKQQVALLLEIEQISDRIRRTQAANDNTSAIQRNQGQAQQLELLNAEIASLGTDSEARAVMLAQLQAEQQLREQGRDVTDALSQAYIREAGEIAKANELYRQQQANLQELGSIAGQVSQDIYSTLQDAATKSGSAFDKLRDIGLAALKDISQALWQLSVTNPLQNWITGGSAPTAGGLFNTIGSLFGGAPTNSSGYRMTGAGPGASANTGGGFFSSIGSWFSSLWPFAGGGIMTSGGPLALHRYAWGGIADRPQLAMYGEGSNPEAYVPLPDGRSIPVTMSAPPANSNWQGAGPIAFSPTTVFQVSGGIDKQTELAMHRVAQGHAAAMLDAFKQSINTGGADAKLVGRRRK